MRRRILVTGGCGFLGTNLAREVQRGGEGITVLDDLSREGSRKNLDWLRSQGPLDFREGDVRDLPALERTLREVRPHVVFHLAGQVAMTSSVADPLRDFTVNALGTLHVLEALRRHDPDAVLVYSSTNKVYGDLEGLRYEETPTRWRAVDHPRGFDESLPLDLRSPYGCSKGAADQYVLDFARVYGLRTVVFRHSSIFGDRQFSTVDQGWIGWFLREAVERADGLSTGPLSVSGDGKQVRDVLYASDAVACYMRAAERIDDVRGQALNVGGGMENSLSLLELFARIRELVGVRLDVRHLPPRQSDQRVFVADTGKAERLLGWRPLVGCEEGLRRMLAWTRSAA